MKNSRFEVVFNEGSTLSTQETILVDRETGVAYLFVQTASGAGLTPLLDADGKPYIAKSDIK